MMLPLPPRRILVPLDGSKLSAAVMGYAAMLADVFGAQLVLFTALTNDVADGLGEFAVGENVSIDEAVHGYLRRLVTDGPGADVEIRSQRADNPATAIVEMAGEADVDLIVMSSHGQSGVTRWLLGSVADKVVQSSPVPVVILPVAE